MRFDSSADYQFTIGGVSVGTWNAAGLTLPEATPLNVLKSNAPSSPSNGDLWITSSGLFARVAGATVGPMGTGGGGGMTNPMTTAGDIIYGGTPSGGVAPPTSLGITAGGILYGGTSAPAYTATANMSWDNTNKRLGLGVASPATVLDILQTASATSAVQLSNLSTGTAAVAEIRVISTYAGIASQGIYLSSYGSGYTTAGLLQNSSQAIKSDGDNGLSIIATVGTIKFATGGTAAANERARIDTNGYLLINKTSGTVNYRLDIGNTTANDSYARVQNTSTAYSAILDVSGSGSTARIRSVGSAVGGTTATSQNNTGVYEATGGGGLNLVASNASGAVKIFTGGVVDDVYPNAFNRRVTIASGGDIAIGMGTASPAYRLDIQDEAASGDVGIRFRNTTTTSTGRSIFLLNAGTYSTALYAYPASYVQSGAQVPDGGMVYNGGPGGLSVASGASAPINFYTGGTAAGNHRMIIGAGGNVGIAGYAYNSVPTYTLSFGGEAARTIGMERRTTAAGGNQLNIRAGGAQSASASSDLNGGALFLIPGVSTGTGMSLTRIQGYSTALATGTGDNTAVDRAAYGMCKVNFHATSANILTCLPASGTGASFIVEYCLELRGSSVGQYYIRHSDTITVMYNNAGTLTSTQGGTGVDIITRDATNPAFNLIFTQNTTTGAVSISVSNTANPWASGIVTSRFTYTVRYFGHTQVTGY